MEEKLESSNKKQKTEYFELDNKLKSLCDLFNELNKNSQIKYQFNINENINFVKKRQNEIKRDKYTIFFFGNSAGGKSFLINFLISGVGNYPLPSGNQDGPGLTKTPMKICFSSAETIKVTQYQKSSEFFSKEVTIEQSTDYLSKYIKTLNDDDSVKYVIIEYPEKLIFEKHCFLKNFELIDLMGIEPNDKSRDININTNKTFVDTFDFIDEIFYVSRQGRGKIGEQDIENMYYCGLFQKCSKYSSPTIVSISLCDFDNESRETQSLNESEESLYSIYEALSKVFNYNLNRLNLPDKEKILEKISTPIEKEELFILAKMHSVGKMIENSKRIKIFKCENSHGLSECSIKSFNDEILDKIKEFKKKCSYFQLTNYANEIVNTLETTLRWRDKRKKINKNDEKKVYDQIYKFLYVNETSKGFKKNLIKTIDNIVEDLNNFEEELNPDNSYEIFTNYSSILNEKMQKFIIFVGSEIIKIFDSFKNYDIEKNELMLDFKYLKELAESFTDLNNDNRIKTILKEKPINSIKQNIKEEIEKLLKNIPWLIIENSNSSEIQFKASIKKELEELKKYFQNEKVNLNLEIYGSSKTYSLTYNLPEPIRFESNNTIKIPSFVDQQNNSIHKNPNNISAIIDSLKEKQFINRSVDKKTKENIINKTKIFFSDFIENNLKLKLDVLEKNNKLVDIERGKSCNEIQIDINENKQEIVAKCDYVAIYDDLKDLNEKIKEFRLKFLTKDAYQDKISTSLEPIFVWSDLNHFKNIFILQELQSKLDHKNFRIFLFLEIDDRKSELKKEICNLFKNNNSITLVFINKNDFMKEKNTIGKARILKIMFMVAELFQIENFFYIGQNVIVFQEFIDDKHQTNSDTSIRALSFMSKTMFRVLTNSDNKQKNFLDLKDCLSKEEIKKMKSFLMKDFWYSIKFDKIEKKCCENLKEKINENLFGSNENVQNQDIIFLIQNLKIKEHLLNYEEKNNCDEKYSDTFEKYFQYLNAPNMTTVGQITLKKIYGKDYEKFICRLIGVSNDTHNVCKDQESDVIYYNMNAIKKLHPVHDKFFFDSKFVLDEKQLINEYYYYKMVHFVSNVLLYHFTYDTKDIDNFD